MVGASSRLLFLVTNPTSFLHHRPSALIRLVRRQSLTFPFTTLSAAPNHLCRLTRPNSLISIKFSQKIYSTATNYAFPENNHSPANSHHVPTSHPWPEWARLIESLTVSGYYNGNSNIEDEFVTNENLSMGFVAAANSCLAFARNRPDVLGWLPRKDIEVLIDDGHPFLFKNAHETERRMRSFLQVSDFNEASSVAFMKYILSYASTPIIYPERKIKENTESSVRSLLQEMASLINRPRASEQFQAVGRDEQMPRNFGPNITMKRGDWICPKCNFMNFARNTKCLECEELRPQRQLTGGEWDCPRCNFFNFPKNILCLRCECRRPDEAPLNGSNSGYVSSVPIQNYSAEAGRDSQSREISTTYATSRHIQDIDKEDKTERWFRKVKELHGVTSDVSHDDFPQIIPMRKEENPSVDNKRKDPPSSPYQRKQAMEQGSTSSFVPFVPFPPDYFSKKVEQQQPKDTDTKVKLTDEISSQNTQGQSNNASLDKNHVQGAGNQQMSTANNLDSGMSSRDTNLGSYRNQFPINEPKPETSYVGQKIPETPNGKSGWTGKSLEGSAVTEPDPLDMSEEAKAERWFRRVAQIKDISELSQIPDEDFPSIMPMRKGVNRFVVSKRKTPLERRLTSPQYRKNLRIMSSDPMKKEGNDDS